MMKREPDCCINVYRYDAVPLGCCLGDCRSEAGSRMQEKANKGGPTPALYRIRVYLKPKPGVN